MKFKLVTQSVKCYTLVAFLLCFSFINAKGGQVPFKARYSPLVTSDYTLSLINLTQTTDRTIDFDVYLLDITPAAQTFELSSVQLGIMFNLGINSTGTLSLTMNNTGSGLTATSQQFPSAGIVVSLAGYPNQGLIRVSGKSAAIGSGAIISKVGNGTFLSHFTVTNTVPWVYLSTPNFVFTSDLALNPLYATRVNEVIAQVATQLTVTPGTNAIVVGNPLLNLSTGLNQNEADKYQIYSMNKNIFVDCPVKTKHIYVYDTLGSSLMFESNVSGMRKFDLNNYPKAYYFVKIFTEDNVYTQKVLLK